MSNPTEVRRKVKLGEGFDRGLAGGFEGGAVLPTSRPETGLPLTCFAVIDSAAGSP